MHFGRPLEWDKLITQLSGIDTILHYEGTPSKIFTIFCAIVDELFCCRAVMGKTKNVYTIIKKFCLKKILGQNTSFRRGSIQIINKSKISHKY